MLALFLCCSMTDLPAAVARPLLSMLNNRGRGGGGNITDGQMATMSRPRFVTFQLVTLTTAFLTCLTVLGLAVLKNTELQDRILNWGDTASCILNVSQTDLHLTKENPDAELTVFDWNHLLQVLLQLGTQCSSTSDPNTTTATPGRP